MGNTRKSGAYPVTGFGAYAESARGGFTIKISADGKTVSVCYMGNDGQVDSASFNVGPSIEFVMTEKEWKRVHNAAFRQMSGDIDVEVFGYGPSAPVSEGKADA